MTGIQVYHHKVNGRGCRGRSRDDYFTSKPVADPAEGAWPSDLFLKQTEARGERQRRAGFRYYIKWRFWSTINIMMNVFVYTCMK